jgi:hypothetical protein
MISVLVMLIAAAAPATSRVNSSDVDKRLSFLVGSWTRAGQARTYREDCSWYRNRSFVVCNSQNTRDGSTAQTVYGYSRLRQRFTYQYYDSTGASIFQLGFPAGAEGIVFTDERPTAAGSTRLQMSYAPDELGVPQFSEYRSVNGGPWQLSASYEFQPLRRARKRR